LALVSVFFVQADSGDVWNPPSAAAQAFLAQVNLVEELLGEPSGLGPLEADQVVIDRERWLRFCERFVALFLSHAEASAFHALLEACLAVALGLAERLGSPVSREEPRLAHVRELGARLVR
jgi:hypothetical protein